MEPQMNTTKRSEMDEHFVQSPESNPRRYEKEFDVGSQGCPVKSIIEI
jgi:hypothetical protein